MAGTNELFDIQKQKCYKCRRYIKHAGHRLHCEWFCMACWYYIKNNGLIHLYERDIEPYDWDLARKEKLIAE